MSADPKNDRENPEKASFIRETVVPEKPRTPWWKKLLLTVLLALVFGLVAAAVFTFAQDFFRSLRSEETQPAESILFPTDEETDPPVTSEAAESTAEASGESLSETAESTDCSCTEPPTAEDMAALWESMMAEHSLSLGDTRALYGAAGELVREVSRSLVRVTATNKSVDLFETEYSVNTETFGIVVARTSQEILILTPEDLTSRLSENSALTISFSNTSAGAYTKATDSISGLAVLAVPVKSLSEAALNSIRVMELGNSFGCSTGQPVIALGAPAGYIGSVGYGILSFVESDAPQWDNSVRLLHTDMNAGAASRGFLIDLDGRLLGWLSPETDGFLTAVGISDIKSYIENLSNGKSIGYLGIQGTGLPVSLKDKLTESNEGGIYLLNCAENGPALTAGLQSGDIIVKISDQKVSSVPALRSCLLSMNTEQTVSVTVLRKAGLQYRELVFDVKIERR